MANGNESGSGESSKVVPIGAGNKRASEKKWGPLAMKAGFSILPAILFRGQARLGLSNQQLVLLLHLADHWWDAGNVPWPKKETLADRMGLSEKQIQRLAAQLEKAGYLARERRMRSHGQTSNGYNLKGLVKKLNEIAPEFISVREARSKVEKPRRKRPSANG